ncbi:MAG: hypothetical protein JWM85_620 [Acidimicrobiaceae bacterium]|nr:hypothetical protein [Acidimicrobiaceae bacterium]
MTARVAGVRVGRARAALVGAAVLSVAVLVLELPLGELLRQRQDLASAGSQLAAVQAADKHLAADVASLKRPATVAAIAHQDYGLVQKGQRAYVVLPTAGSPSALAGSGTIPTADLVPSSVSPYGSADSSGSSAPARPTAGLWRRVLDRLEFWRSAF